MKNKILLRCTLLALIVFSFFACENEPLEGEFLPPNPAPIGGLIAKIDGVDFQSSQVVAIYSNGGILISAVNSEGRAIGLGFLQLGICDYDLSQSSSGSVVETDQVTYSSLGVSGTATITTLDQNSLTLTGSFEFEAEVFDITGQNVSTERRVVTEGFFNQIPFENLQGDTIELIDCSLINDAPDPIDPDPNPIPTDPIASCNFDVDGVEFIIVEITAELIMVGNNEVIRVIAKDEINRKIEFLIPRELGVGTFAMSPIFDGTALVASYDEAQGGEPLTSTDGFMTFTEFGQFTGKLEATFDFTARDPFGVDPRVRIISNGVLVVDFLPDSGTVPNEFVATIDGEEYLPEVIEITKQPVGEFTVVNLTTINNTENRGVSLSFPIDIQPLEYSMAPFVEVGDEKVGIYNPDIGNSILFKSDETGTLRILSYQYSNGVVEGRFSYLATDPLGNDPQQFLIEGSFVITIP